MRDEKEERKTMYIHVHVHALYKLVLCGRKILYLLTSPTPSLSLSLTPSSRSPHPLPPPTLPPPSPSHYHVHHPLASLFIEYSSPFLSIVSPFLSLHFSQPRSLLSSLHLPLPPPGVRGPLQGVSVCRSAGGWVQCRGDACSVGVPGGALHWHRHGRPALGLQVSGCTTYSM